MKQALRALAALWLVPGLVLGWLKSQAPLTIQRLTVDPSALAGVPAYTGILSNAGVALWLSCASILLFCARRQRFLWLPGMLSLMLGMDDGLMLHEELVPLWLGLSDRVVQPGLYMVYAALLGLTVRQLRPWLKEPQFLILLAASACLGASISVDMVIESNWLSARHPLMLDESYAMWLEDGLKLLGIVAWWGYWTGFCARRMDDQSKL